MMVVINRIVRCKRHSQRGEERRKIMRSHMTHGRAWRMVVGSMPRAPSEAPMVPEMMASTRAS